VCVCVCVCVVCVCRYVQYVHMYMYTSALHCTKRAAAAARSAAWLSAAHQQGPVLRRPATEADPRRRLRRGASTTSETSARPLRLAVVAFRVYRCSAHDGARAPLCDASGGAQSVDEGGARACQLLRSAVGIDRSLCSAGPRGEDAARAAGARRGSAGAQLCTHPQPPSKSTQVPRCCSAATRKLQSANK
jgi:hypothetical protein